MAHIIPCVALVVFTILPLTSSVQLSSREQVTRSLAEDTASERPLLPGNQTETIQDRRRNADSDDVSPALLATSAEISSLQSKRRSVHHDRPNDTSLLEMEAARVGRVSNVVSMNRSQVSASTDASVMTAIGQKQEKLRAEVHALEKRRAGLKLELGTQVQQQMRAQMQAQVQAQLEVQVQAEVAEAVQRQVRAQVKSQGAATERQARARAEAAMELKSQRALERFQGRLDSAASAVVTIETSIEDAASQVDKTVTWVEEMHKEYPNTQAFFLGTVLLIGIGCGFTVCWGDVERLTMKKDRGHI